MFREIRKKKNILNIEEAKNLLKKERRGVLSLNGDDGYPYGIPINYLYVEEENIIIFHGSKQGHKVDSLTKSNKACFTVYGNVVFKEEKWAPYVQSVICFGRCKLITDQNDIIRLAKIFASKYYPNDELIDKEIEKSIKALQMYVIEIEHLSGKQIQEK